MASPTSSTLQLVLRISLLAGALLDAALIATLMTDSFSDELSASLTADAVSYSWLLGPALAGRAGLQVLSCYDRRRYDSAIPWLAVTLITTGLAAWLQGTVPAGLVASYGLLGTGQLISWRRTR